MSGRGGGRGGGGFRGGRGGGARGSLANVAWANDPTLKADMRPSEVFPEYVVPTAAPLTTREKSQVSSYLLVCEQIHSGPLYTQTRTWNVDSDTPLRTYGQEQVNQRYGVKNKATVDPFFSMPMYSKRLERRERTLPDLSARPFMKTLFPAELHDTLDGNDGAGKSGRGGAGKKKVLTLSDVHSLRTAEDIFGRNETEEERKKRLEALAKEEEDGDLDAEDEEGMEEEMDDEFEDSDEGDYNAEAYFDGNDYDDYDEGDDGAEGIY
ncbi:hypothetical protein MCOR27_007795 [Pyricularia oryzae]|uniref:DNA-directed RNA polymerase III subunit n=5 Tax=Pyricularia TaxID=48558 RepID=A0ABQ8NXX5_PYRGI|nr:uncharacterized protein MGG_10697 [Pyricularia oryzae 70-15]ELQ42976.1 hypothetical protein OOU_Y34scaffold00180g18 [Pyricularia oryzae Y34]KAH8846441.1 hypothetical protein MCOR01_003639 [Pyricularia oryzae]KAI6303676.1 hypothetical protein MCOR33_001196 [Pyricularia grisea]EHA47981.1 hypothetical protein MGG_10697 [Pyricularia oryzae 70-15]KAH9432045.1 hypothetical protein MCOR02_006752 [Pyricularia oryzae]